MILTTRTCFHRVFLVIPLFLLCSILMAANNQPGEKITLNEKATPLKKVFNKITSQTGIKFVYSNRLIDDQQPVSVSVREATLEEALQQIFIGRRFEMQRPNPKSVVLVVHEKITERKSEVISSSKKSDNAVFDITGTVTDTAGASIPGATVLVRGTNKATATDANGQFSLQGIQQNMTLLVSSIGFQTREVRLGNNTDINVKLSAAVNNLDESVIVAYNTTTQRDNVGSITVVKGEDIQSLPNRSFDRSLQGLVPGLQITKGTGQPGGGISNMVIRGIATGTDVSSGQTVRNPLIVIDGIPVTQDNFQFQVSANTTPINNPLAQLNPSDIETISVLKDAVAIALYGSRASNGVILVTTKRGKIGKTAFNFRHQTDIASKLIGKVEVLNQQEYLGMIYDTYRTTNPTQWTDQAILADLKSKFPTRPDGSFYPTPDWYDALYNDRATTSSTEISMSGGNEKSIFYLNLEYTKQNGIVKKTGYDRKSFRFNFEHRPITWLKLGLNSTFSYNKQDYTNYAESASGFAAAMFLSPLNPIRLADGSYKLIYTQGATSSTMQNPVAAAEYNMSGNVAYRGLTNLFGELRLLKYLTLRSNVGIDFMLAELKEKTDPRFYTSAIPPQIRERNARRLGLISTNTLRFDKTINSSHILNLTLGQEAQVNTDKLLGAEVVGNAETSPYFDQLNSSGYTMYSVTGSSRRQTLLSLFGQANYNFKSKYFLSSSIRRDGSSKFGDQQQWGTYWSIGAGWILTGEKFIKESMPWLNYLKLRGSMGAAGNSGAVDNFTRFDLLYRAKYLGSPVVAPQATGNPIIRWEQTFTWDAGLEVRFLQERVSITADIYKRKTRDLIYSTMLPSLSGFSSVLANIGNIENKGVELSLNVGIIRQKAFNWNINANWSSNQNILIKANVPLATISGGILGNEEGRNFNSFYLPIWAGVNPADGKPQWLDNAGKPTSNYNLAKKEFAGKPQPDGYGAVTNTFNYKGFDLSAQFYYQYGLTTYNSSLSFPLQADGLYPFVNQTREALDYWKKPGDIASNPRRLLSNTDRGNSASTRYLFKGDYIRLANLTLAYTFPKKMLEPLHINSIRVFVQGSNLATITNYPGPDPDNVSVGGSTKFVYPNQKSFSVGLNVGF
jgi:TonB-linked SusC/RagA family outer membrane protein